MNDICRFSDFVHSVTINDTLFLSLFIYGNDKNQNKVINDYSIQRNPIYRLRIKITI